jgi:glycosyltransferase involved in cell wall biosynthesis
VIEGETGFLCKPCDETDLSRALGQYFQSDLFKNLDEKRQDIRAYVEERHSWTTVAEITNNVYAELLRN